MLKKQEIVDYYDQCKVDYQNNWHLDDCLALHIGYWDETTRSLPQALHGEASLSNASECKRSFSLKF